MRVASILELRKTILSEKGRCTKHKYLFPYAVQKAEKKVPTAHRTFAFGKVRSSQALSGEKLLFSVGSTSNQVSMPRHKCMHTEDLGQPGWPAGSGAGCDAEQCSAYRHPQGQHGAEMWHFCS